MKGLGQACQMCAFLYLTKITLPSFIEMKYGKNKPTESQQHWLHMLETWGNKAVICYTFEEARDTILNYLKQAA